MFWGSFLLQNSVLCCANTELHTGYVDNGHYQCAPASPAQAMQGRGNVFLEEEWENFELESNIDYGLSEELKEYCDLVGIDQKGGDMGRWGNGLDPS